MKREKNTYRFEPVLHVEADGVVATHLRLDHTKHALFAVLGDGAVEELLFISLEEDVNCKKVYAMSIMREKAVHVDTYKFECLAMCCGCQMPI